MLGHSNSGVTLISNAVVYWTLIKKKRKFSSYIRKFRRVSVAKSYIANDLLIHG